MDLVKAGDKTNDFHDAIYKRVYFNTDMQRLRDSQSISLTSFTSSNL